MSNIKRLLLLVIVLFAGDNAYTQQIPPSANEIISEACKIATKENKNILILFTASWCVWCKKMDRSIKDTTCKSFFDDNFVISHLVVDEMKGKKHLENPGADSLRNLFGGKELGIPYWLIFNKKGMLLFNSGIKVESSGEMGNIGCPATENEVKAFTEKLRRTSNLSEWQLEIIYNRFRKNELLN